MGGDEYVDHVVVAWTVGQLRAALQGLSDEFPIVVWVPEQPGEPLVQEFVITDAGHSTVVVGTHPDRVDDQRRLGVTVDWPTGRYPRASRRPPTREA